MAIQLGATARQAIANGTGLATIANGGSIVTYSGSVPDPDVAATGTLLATHTLPTPAFTVGADDGAKTTLTLGTVATVNAVASGTLGYSRILDSLSNVIFQGTAGIGADFAFNGATTTSGAAVAFTSGTIDINQ